MIRRTGQAIGVVLLLLVACTGYALTQMGAESHRAQGITWFTTERFAKLTGASDVGYIGRIALSGRRCLGVQPGADDPEGEVEVVVWPRGTEVLERGGELRVRIGGHLYRIGDPILYGRGAAADLFGPQGRVTSPPRCPGKVAHLVLDPDPL